MKVLVTGGIGNVGTQVVARLDGAGHEVTVIGRRDGIRAVQSPALGVEGAQYVRCDVTDMRGLEEVVAGKDAIVHLAAFGNPSMGTPDVIFNVNCQGTMNVYEAAARRGIRRVVAASSINAIGYGMGCVEWRVSYFPIDEEHPTYATDAYSFSKTIAEKIAEFYWRREGISGASLRLPAVVTSPANTPDRVREVVACMRSEFASLKALPSEGRRQRIDGWMARLARARKTRLSENPNNPGLFPDAPLMATRQDWWSCVDERDAALAVELALTRSYDGSHVLFVTDSHNGAGIPSRELAALFYPEVKSWKREVPGTESLVSIERARKLLGYEPQHSFAAYY